MEGERKRAPNFSLQEKSVLLSILHKFKDIIENKKTNSQSWRDKDEAWQKITDMFNAQNPETFLRTKDALRKFYDNIKKNVRKEVADEKKEIFRTGGGVVRCVPNPIKDLALGLMNPKTVTGLHNEFDSDAFENYANLSDREIENSNTEFKVRNLDHDYFEELHCTAPLTNQTTSFVAPVVSNDGTVMEETISNLEPSTSKGTKRAHTVKIQKPKSECLKSPWLRRRRPAIQQLPSSKLTEQYLSLSQIKIEYFQAEKEIMKAREKREQEIFQMQKRKLAIEIEIQEENLKQLKNKNE